MTTNSSKIGQRIGLFISLAVSLGIVAYLFAKLDWQEVWSHLRKVNPWFPPLLLVSFIPLIWIRAMRWRLILPKRDQLSIPRLMDATIIGLFASFVLPLRAGEIIRPWALSRWQPVSFSASLASIMIERLADSVCLLTLMLVCLTQVAEVPAIIMTGAKALALLTFALIMVVVLSYLLPGRVEAVFHWISNRVIGRFIPHVAEKVNHMVSEYFAGLRVINSLGQLTGVLLWSFAMWILVAGWYQALLWAFGIYPSFWVGMILNVMIALAVAAPSAPGFIGVFQVGCILALSTVYHYSEEFAVAYSVIGHLLQMLFSIGAGLIVLHLRGLKFSQIRNTTGN